MLPDFIIIGAQKSASTFMNKVLREHPGIYMPLQEIPFFERDDLDQQTVEEYFADLFAEHEDEKLRGIKRPNYLGTAGVAARIHKFVPRAKLIVVLRNPVDRLLSGYHHCTNSGSCPIMSFEKGFPRLRAGEWSQKWPRSDHIIAYGFYYKFLTEYFKYFDREQILILWHEDIKQDKLREIRKAYEFLGIDPDFVPEKSIDKRPQAVIYSMPRLRFVRLRNFGKRISPVGSLGLLRRLVFGVITVLDSWILSRIFGNNLNIRPELRYKLYKIYRDDIDQLEKLLGRDLSGWKMTKPSSNE